MGRPAKALTGVSRSVGSNPTLSASRLTTMNSDSDDFLAARWTGRGRTPARRRATLRGRLVVAVIAFGLLIPVAVALRNDSTPQSVPAPGAVALLTGSGMFASGGIPVVGTVPDAPEGPQSEVATGASSEPSTSTVPPSPNGPVCGEDYTVRRGDSWSRIASEARVSMGALLAVNGAVVDTVLLPDATICLPLGARMPPVPSTVPAATTTTTPACAARYTVRAGDSWSWIASSAQISLRSLLNANAATVDTILLPGRSVCLPPGAQTPAPPTTTTTVPPPARPSTTTTVPGPSAVVRVSPDEVRRLIAEIWPADLVSEAIDVAYRESRLINTVRNFCCYGLFQIYFEVHRSWLAGLGVTRAEQLYDARTNVLVAWTLYQRAGGWGPWGL